MSTAERETIAMGRLELASRDEPGMGSLAEALSSVEGQLGARTGAQAEAARAKKYAAQQQRAAQAAYEEELLREVRRMQQIAKLEVVARRQAEREITERREREARRRAEDQARRTRALERERSEAEAERAAARGWDKKQAETLARQAEVEAQKLAVIERERQERARALRVARDKQEAGMAKAAADRVAQAALQLRMDEAKREALLARLEGRRAERQAEGARKAEVALARVCRALASRTEAADEADAAYAHKAAMQDEGAAQLTLQQRTRAEEGRERAEFRRESIEGVLSRQHEAEEAAKLAIEARDAARDAAQRAAEAAKAAALEARNEGKYSDFRTARARAAGALLARQAQLENVGAKFAEKMERAEAVLRGREEGAVSRRFLFGKLGRERLAVSNAMQEAKVTKRFRLPAHIRKNVSDPTLRFVLDKADPRETGVIPLDKLSDVLSKMDPALFGADGPTSPLAGAGASAGADGAHAGAADRARAQKAFTRADADADGSIDLAQFRKVVAQVTRQRGMPARPEWAVSSAFAAADADGDGLVDFDEFLSAQAGLEKAREALATSLSLGGLRAAGSTAGSASAGADAS